jgi:twitching motility protein PilT
MLMKIVEKAALVGASDIHITYGSKPIFRINGSLLSQQEFQENTDEVIEGYLNEVLDKESLHSLKNHKQLDLAIDTPWTRCRANVFMQRCHYDMALRLIDYRIKSLDELGLNKVLKDLAVLRSGLILVTGVAGSGKSTTLAAIIDYINANHSKNIITFEDPIEYVHSTKKGIIRQREVGRDVISFSDGLRAALREDPDVLLVGEMRDLETISSAITLAETGHLVFATLHTRNAAETIDRIIDVFPPDQQQQIRIQLSHVLQAVISQTLIPKKSGGRAVCLEIMRTTIPIRNMIKTKDNVSKIKDEIFFNKPTLGTQTMTQGLADMHLNGVIDRETGLKYSESEELFNRLVQRRGLE